MACGARVPSVVLGVVAGGHERAGDEKGQEAKDGQGRVQGGRRHGRNRGEGKIQRGQTARAAPSGSEGTAQEMGQFILFIVL